MSGPPTESVPSLGVGADQRAPSRETSPGRMARSVSSIPQLSRSRKSSQEFSPTRASAIGGPLSTVPSAAAVQRALSAHRPILQPSTTTDGSMDGTRAQDRPPHRVGHTSPSWPTSPRLKSPPPTKTVSRAPGAKKLEAEPTPSNTSLKRLAATSQPDPPPPAATAALSLPDGQEPNPTPPALRPPGRGPSAGGSTLETVAESSMPTTPSIGPTANPMDQTVDAQALDPAPESRSEAGPSRESDGSGGDGGRPATKAENGGPGPPSRAPSTTRSASELAKRSFTNLAGAKAKPSTDPPRTMTVETETVTSMPQLLNPDRGAAGRDGNGSVRTKPSTETIRPKKEKKKASRKAPSLHAGTVTSKADLFEAKVASAVDEADSSDSDETFVYESNPPDNRPVRHHSRTPSATSLASQEQYGARGKHGVRSGSHAISGKKSMKFSNSTYNNHLDGEVGPDGRGSQRHATTTPRHHHISRHGRPHHTSLFDADSPFSQANKAGSPRSSSNNLARHSRPNSPRLANGRLPGTPRKEPYDTYDDAADDERAPLISSVRVNRARHGRRPHSAAFRPIYYGDGPDQRACGRHGGCMFLAFVIVLVCVGIAMFAVALNRPLVDVSIKSIQNVLASEQELMLDLKVEAVNTNLFVITVNELDVNLFAESAYIGAPEGWPAATGALRWARRRATSASAAAARLEWPPWRSHDGVDEGTDPADDPESGLQKMLLGRILEFDSPLVFDASPVRRSRSSSVGEIRLAQPGNVTDEGRSTRWERVLQHPFDLIVRGVIKYQLPLSSKTRSAKIGGRVQVLPDDEPDNDDSKRRRGLPRLEGGG